MSLSAANDRFTVIVVQGGMLEVRDNGRPFTKIHAGDWARDGKAMVAAWEKGEAFVPCTNFAGRRMLTKDVQAARLELLENGNNATRAVQDWVRHQAANEAREGGVFGAALGAVEAEQWPALAREVFDSLFNEKPEDLDPPAVGTGWISELMAQAEARGEWRDLREQVKGDAWATGIAAGHVAKTLAEKAKGLLEAIPKQDPQRLAEEAQCLGDVLGKKSPRTKRAEKRAEAVAEQAETVLGLMQDKDSAIALGAVLSDAAEGAAEEVEAIVSGAANMADLSSGALRSVKGSPETMRAMLAANPNLRKLVELAGRLRIRARAKQRTKTKYAPESIVDVTLGGEIDRLLPSELAMLVIPETKMLLLRKVLEREAQQYELEGEEDLDRGPVIVAVDSSGSMKGIRNQWAMAVAIAVLEVAAMQRRAFVLMHFDGQVQASYTVPKPSSLTLDKLVEMVSFFSGGGTNFAPPLAQAHGIISAEKHKDGTFARADVMLITDGQASWGSWAQQLKATGAALYGVAIAERFSEPMAKELTGCIYVDPSTLNDNTANVDLLFGI